MLKSIADNPFLQSMVALGIWVVSLVAAAVAQLTLRVAARRLERRTPEGVSHRVLNGVRNSAVLFVVFIGIFLALIALPTLEPWRDAIRRGWTLLVVLLLGRVLANITTVLLDWYVQRTETGTTTQFVDMMLPVFRRTIFVIIYGVTALIALDTLGVSISPLLGGLGLGGLAVALALQPTLGNFFAGTHVLSEGVIRTGDYIELKDGPAGYVSEVGWRSTKVRSRQNNLIIIPNSVLADTIVTNYQGPDPAMNVIVKCGVSYDSDLEKVERVSLEVANQLVEENPQAVTESEPWFGFDEFGDSNIGLWIFVQAKDRLGSFAVTSELIKRLHARFASEGIEINYPMRKLVYANGAPVPLSKQVE